MRKTTLLLALGFALFTATGAQALCLEFVNFCDALEVSEVDTGAGEVAVTGVWFSYDCVGSNANVIGTVRDGKAGVSGDPFLTGDPFLFSLNIATSTFDLYQGVGAGAPLLFQDDQPYELVPGDCSLDDERSKLPSLMDSIR